MSGGGGGGSKEGLQKQHNNHLYDITMASLVPTSCKQESVNLHTYL